MSETRTPTPSPEPGPSPEPLAPPLTMTPHPVLRFALVIVVVGLVLVVIALTGVANPRLGEVNASTGEWNQETSVGVAVLRIENHGLFPVDVVGVRGQGVGAIERIVAVPVEPDAPMTATDAAVSTPAGEARLEPRSTVDLIIEGQFRCDLVEPGRFDAFGHEFELEAQAPFGPVQTSQTAGLIPMQCPSTGTFELPVPVPPLAEPGG